MGKIDIVMPWVDGSDPEWQKEKQRYDNSDEGDKRINRYRDWDLLPYWFRGVEKYLPWIHQIHFITWGHIPSWLSQKNEKLHIVRHEDYIDKKYLPTFSSHPIEWNIHKIDGLSDQFIYANDDMFFVSPVKEEDYFKGGLPVDCAIQTIQCMRDGGIDHIHGNDLQILDRHFVKKEVIKKNTLKWFHPKYKKFLLKSLYTLPMHSFPGFRNPHIPFPYLKQSFQEVWDAEPELLDKTCSHKFRSIEDVNQWLVRYWQFASGKFVPGNPYLGKLYSIGRDDEQIAQAIKTHTYKTICLSDDAVEGIDFETEKAFLIQQFEKILPEKSSFEI